MTGRNILPLLALLFYPQKFVSALSNGPAFGVNVRLAAKPGRRDEMAALLRLNRDATLKNEPLSQQFAYGPDADDPAVFHLHERFASREGFEQHRSAEHLADWRSFKATDPFAVAPTFDFYNLAEGSGAAPAPPPGPGIFCLNVDIRIRPEVRAEFLEVIRNNARGSNQDEPLCLQYAWGEDAEVRNLFHFHEEYKGGDGGREGFGAHAAAPHFKEWEKFAGDGGPFVEPPVVKFFTTL